MKKELRFFINGLLPPLIAFATVAIPFFLLNTCPHTLAGIDAAPIQIYRSWCENQNGFGAGIGALFLTPWIFIAQYIASYIIIAKGTMSVATKTTLLAILSLFLIVVLIIYL